eukprot:3390827-Pleurochrysis_carterae.AAC.2
MAARSGRCESPLSTASKGPLLVHGAAVASILRFILAELRPAILSQAKSFANLDPEEEINYRFTKMSFKDGEARPLLFKLAIFLLHDRTFQLIAQASSKAATVLGEAA